jgi:endonuclease VIII
MPEGDTIATLAGRLHTVLAGQRLQLLEVLRPVRWCLEVCTVAAIHSQGKHLFIELDSGHTVHSHLGMYGRWRTYSTGTVPTRERRRAHLVITHDDYTFVCVDAMEVGVFSPTGDTIRRKDLARRIGPDLTRLCDVAVIVASIRENCAPEMLLVDLLLHQRPASGIGNVFKSELLFASKLPVQLRLTDVDDVTVHGLYQQANDWLRANVGPGRRTTRTHTGDRPGSRVWVYGRTGKPCLRCRERVVSAPLGQKPRCTYWCPRCQHNAPAAKVCR